MLTNLSKKQQEEFFSALYYMNMAEIKEFCNKHKIPATDKKGPIIERIKHYLLTGEILSPPILPAIAKAKKDRDYPLKPNALILKGAYINDLQTRQFFQKLIGSHFHFTAFGQDWILERWYAGKPPTYAEFAKFWEKEFSKRKNSKANPRQEWAYLNFLQRYQKINPNISRAETMVAWEKKRALEAAKAKKILGKIK